MAGTTFPELGAIPEGSGTTFRVWASRARHVEVRLFEDPSRPLGTTELEPRNGGIFEAHLPEVKPGSLYMFLVDGRQLPDPYARFLPFGVEGPAEVVPRARVSAFDRGRPPGGRVIYELHVGTFTPEGTYAAAQERLAHLADLGVTAIELMPLSSFPGKRGWGYDGVCHFAPLAAYGRPESLRAFVAAAHAKGLAVILDAVYNHFGPRGNYLGAYAPEYFSKDASNPWGDAPNFGTPAMRSYVLANARMWFDEYGFDGLRLDATHTLRDPSPRHILKELRDVADAYLPRRALYAEDDRNDPVLVSEYGMDGIWADDFHHQIRVLLTGERDGYYAAYEPVPDALARTIERGWLYEGQRYLPWKKPRGKPAGMLEPQRFVYCIENHDQVGNRALGDRLDQRAGVDALRTATLVLLFLPMTPLLFMGQEWAASSPFQYFTDHDPEQGALVSKGRREEFKAFPEFSSDAAQDRIPDPQLAGTFERSKLDWEETEREPHRSVLEAVRRLLRLRREDPILRAPSVRSDLRARTRGHVLVVERRGPGGSRTLVANLSARAADGGPLPSGKLLFSVGEVGEGGVMGPFALGIWNA